MDALLTALLVCMIAEMGDRCQLLTLALSVRYRRPAVVVAGMVAAGFANAALSAAAGGMLALMLGSNARALFLALALLATGLGLLIPAKAPDTLSGWRIGAFSTSALGLFILGFGNGAQFLTAAIAVRTADPVMTAIGAGLGVSIACVPVVLLRQGLFTALPIKWIRRIGGISLVLIGAVTGLGAIGLL